MKDINKKSMYFPNENNANHDSIQVPLRMDDYNKGSDDNDNSLDESVNENSRVKCIKKISTAKLGISEHSNVFHKTNLLKSLDELLPMHSSKKKRSVIKFDAQNNQEKTFQKSEKQSEK